MSVCAVTPVCDYATQRRRLLRENVVGAPAGLQLRLLRNLLCSLEQRRKVTTTLCCATCASRPQPRQRLLFVVAAAVWQPGLRPGSSGGKVEAMRSKATSSARPHQELAVLHHETPGRASDARATASCASEQKKIRSNCSTVRNSALLLAALLLVLWA